MIERPLNDAERWFAAEHAMGLTEGDARMEAEHRMERDPRFRAEVEMWQADMEPLLDRVEAKRPPRAVWSGLSRRIAGEAGPAGTSPGLTPLRGFALFGAGSLLGALMLLALFTSGVNVPGVAPSPETVRFAVLSGGGAEGVVTVRKGDGGRIVSVRHDVAVPAGRIAEAWVIPDGGAPRHLGAAAESAPIPVDAPIDGTFAVSIEPLGASLEGGPTGPVVLTGTLHSP